MKISSDLKYKGTQILFGNSASSKREMINALVDYLPYEGFKEISFPVIQFQETFKNKVGEENNNLMFSFTDRANRNLCLAPEYTSLIQNLSKTQFKSQKDVKIFYVGECFRGEKPQLGRYRQFTQFGIEIVNPSKDYLDYLINLSERLLDVACDSFGLGRYTEDNSFKVNQNVTRGLDYYTGKGFEIEFGNSGCKQVVGGGEYDGGIGFAIGIDRLIDLLNEFKKESEIDS